MEELNKIYNDNGEEEVVFEKEDTSSGSEVITKPFNPNDIDIETPPFLIYSLIDKIKHGEINMNTDFQRAGNLWSDEMQSRLIESVLLGLPLPAFFFDTSVKPWNIIDGLQRCCAIYNFCIKKDLRLQGLEFLGEKDEKPYLNGLTFDELNDGLQRSINMRPITINLIKKADRKVRFILFKRLNTGGLELTPQEIRNAVYQGKAIDTVNLFAKFDEFLTATEQKIPKNRMQDRDFVSRFIAFYLNDYTQYLPGLDDFINSSMEILEKMEKSDIDIIATNFKKSLKLAFNIFGNDAFRKRRDINVGRSPINKAYFEVITTSFAKLNNTEIQLLFENKELLKDNLIEIMKTDRYFNVLSRGTGTTDSVKIRFSWFQKVLNKSINGIKIKVTDDNKIEDKEL
ncbi:MAG: DUF262 domain-containing protein [Candidatus Symbiothrix sp.]|jgi:hypothetical protein|nr:DUF262 domain-containing protein [Candidatus Symbiothrix sp.]